MNGIIHLITTSTSDLDKISKQLSATSTQLTVDSNCQAASIEETSASLEQMSSMTQANSEHATRAKDLASKACNVVSQGSASMQQMVQAMHEIKSSSDEVADILQTIDEIAFQTNILALNAAVEAARAGDAGMGFAVVADEVRNLAQRSAKAAHETSEKIKNSLASSQKGQDICGRVSSSLDNISTHIKEVDDITGEIAVGCTEQNHGIEQINLAVNEICTITQSNAVKSEHCANATSQLILKKESLNQLKETLCRITSGTNHSSKANRSSLDPNPNEDYAKMIEDDFLDAIEQDLSAEFPRDAQLFTNR